MDLIQQLMDAANEQTRKVNALRAENARLRAALESARDRLADAPAGLEVVAVINDIDRALGTDTGA